VIGRLLGPHARIGFDSNVLIYLLEGSSAYAEVAGSLLDSMSAGERQGVLATLAIAEIAAGPARTGDTAMVQRYAEELSSLEGVRIVPLDREVAIEAAIIRGSGSTSLADAIHLATARVAGATAFVTNDRRVVGIPRLAIVYLDDLVGE
jgi:predicted nucleic acid-binding protein